MLQKKVKTKKPASKKAAVKKSAIKKTVVKKGAAKKVAGRKAVAKKVSVKKAAVKKISPAKASVKKRTAISAKRGFTVMNTTFMSGGLNCGAIVYIPGGAVNPPVIIMAHGLGAEMSFSLSLYAEEFAKNGYAVLMFDYRYFGLSEGEPRHIISPKKQQEDWEAAIKFARSMDNVDGNSICLWGYSFSGGHVITLAARDKNIKGFIASVPFMDSFFILKINGMRKDLMINIAAARDGLASLSGKEPYCVPLIGTPDEFALMNTPETFEGYMSMIPEGSEWRNETPGRTLMTLTGFRPFRHIKRIKCRGLVIYGERDSLTDIAKVERYYSDNKQYDLLKLQCGHFDLFRGEYFREALAAQLKFLKDVFKQE